MPNQSVPLKLKTWNTLLDIAVALNLLTEKLFWWARKHRDMCADLMEEG